MGQRKINVVGKGGPADVTVLPSGDIAVAVMRSNCVSIYTQSGEHIRDFGADILVKPFGITSDHSGNVLVVDHQSTNIYIFDCETGELVDTIDLEMDPNNSNKGIVCSDS